MHSPCPTLPRKRGRGRAEYVALFCVNRNRRALTSLSTTDRNTTCAVAGKRLLGSGEMQSGEPNADDGEAIRD
jgi:hypothetical protein